MLFFFGRERGRRATTFARLLGAQHHPFVITPFLKIVQRAAWRLQDSGSDNFANRKPTLLPLGRYDGVEVETL